MTELKKLTVLGVGAATRNLADARTAHLSASGHRILSQPQVPGLVLDAPRKAPTASSRG